MAETASEILLQRIRRHGPITVAEFMDVALYHPVHGYYATASRRSGRSGDFYTSVDVSSRFGEMIAVQLAEMASRLSDSGGCPIDFVEAGAGNGRLARDVLDTLAREFPDVYRRVRVRLVERSAAARSVQGSVLEHHVDRLASSGDELPRGVSGVILANELLDALPVHVARVSERGIDEIYVAERAGRLIETSGPVSDRRISQQLTSFDAQDKKGLRAEVGLAAVDWVRSAASALERGFLFLFDYGAEASALYSEMHIGGTLLACRQHTINPCGWLDAPGEWDLTAHVNLSAIRDAAAAGGLTPLGTIDQGYFLMNLGLIERLAADNGIESIRERVAARTLLMPGGLGSTMKVMVFGKGIGQPALRGFSAGRLT